MKKIQYLGYFQRAAPGIWKTIVFVIENWQFNTIYFENWDDRLRVIYRIHKIAIEIS